MIFLTVGSMFPFDRLIQAVDEMVGNKQISEPIFAQIGDGRYEPRNLPFARFLGKPEYEQRVQAATKLIGHAGAGTIALALAQQKPLLAVPRLKRFNEHVNDHQLATARKFEELGHVLVAYEMAQLPEKLEALKSFVPRPREVRPHDLVLRIDTFLRTLKI